jgi:hypothetical protein
MAAFEIVVRPVVEVTSTRKLRAPSAPAEQVSDAFIRWGAASNFKSDEFRDPASFPGLRTQPGPYKPLDGVYTEEGRTWSDIRVTDPESDEHFVIVRKTNEVALAAPARVDEDPRIEYGQYTAIDQVTFSFSQSYDSSVAIPEYLHTKKDGSPFQPVVLDPLTSIVEVGWGGDIILIVSVQNGLYIGNLTIKGTDALEDALPAITVGTATQDTIPEDAQSLDETYIKGLGYWEIGKRRAMPNVFPKYIDIQKSVYRPRNIEFPDGYTYAGAPWDYFPNTADNVSFFMLPFQEQYNGVFGWHVGYIEAFNDKEPLGGRVLPNTYRYWHCAPSIAPEVKQVTTVNMYFVNASLIFKDLIGELKKGTDITEPPDPIALELRQSSYPWWEELIEYSDIKNGPYVWLDENTPKRRRVPANQVYCDDIRSQRQIGKSVFQIYGKIRYYRYPGSFKKDFDIKALNDAIQAMNDDPDKIIPPTADEIWALLPTNYTDMGEENMITAQTEGVDTHITNWSWDYYNRGDPNTHPDFD